jgi:TPR repeat protein
MSQTNRELREQLLGKLAEQRDNTAMLALVNRIMQGLNDTKVPKDITSGMLLLEGIGALCINENFQGKLAESITVFARTILASNATFAVRLFNLASGLGNFEAKRNLVDCFFYGCGTERQPQKAVKLTKECYEAGDRSVLAVMHTMARDLLYGRKDRVDSIFIRAVEVLVAVELLTFAAEKGHVGARSDLAIVGEWFYDGSAPCIKDIQQGIEILKMTARLGDRRAQNTLAYIGSKMIKTEPKVGFELFSLASELGSLQAKRNLAVCFLKGLGTERQPDKVMGLLKDCYDAGQQSILEDMNATAVEFLSGDNGKIGPDLQKAMKLFTFAAQSGHADAQKNLLVLANHFLAWEKFETGYGIQQDVPTGLKILHYLANTLKDTAANEKLTQIRALKIPIFMPRAPESGPRFNINGLTIGPSTLEEPHYPSTVEFLKRHNVSISAAGVAMGGSGASSSVLSDQSIAQFQTDRSAQKLQHFTGVLNVLNQHFPAVSPIQEIVCGYIPNEVSPLFFQYQRAIVALDKDPQLTCFNTEETPCDSSSVKLHVSCT